MDEVMAVQEGDRLSQVGLAFLNMLASPEELEQDLPKEKRQKREVALQSQPRRKTSEAILSSQQLDLIHEKRREWSGHEIMQVDGATSDQARGLPQLGLYAGLVCAVLPTGELRSLATPASHSKAMARPSCRPSHDPPALLLDSGCDQRVDQQVPELKLQLSDDSTKQAAIKSLTILEDSSFPHLLWHHQHKRLVISQTAPISWSSMETHLGILQQAFLEPTNCVRFFAMASQQGRSEVVPWKLQISMRNDSLSSLLRQLTGSALWHLIGARLKQHGLQRSKLAQDIQMVLRPQGGRNEEEMDGGSVQLGLHQ